MQRFTIPAVGLLAVLGLCLPMQAQVQPGMPAPNLQFRSVDGQQVSLEALRGKIVLVEFWATWCGPCMAQSERKVQVYNQWSDKGLQMIGISRDRDAAALRRVMAEKGFAWPQFYDPTRTQQVAQQWGVSGIPHAFLIDPDGQVVWRGHTAQIERQIEQLFETNPPRLVDPQLLAQANSALDAVMEAIETGDTTSAIKLMGRVPMDAMKDGAFAERATDAHQKLESAAQAMFDEVQPLIDAGQYQAAVTRLQDLSRALAGTPLANRARQELRTLMNKPEARAAIEQAEKAARGEEALAAAERLKEEGKQEQAYQRFRQIAREFAGSEAGTKAAEVVAEYEKDQAFVQQALESAAATRARGDLSLARSYIGSGRTDLARQRYEKILEEFPGTTYAEQAQQELDALKD